MLATLTGAGLSAAAGLNAYIPFLIVALVARFTDFINLPQNFAWIESSWAIGIATVLLISETILDKVAVVDSINDAVGTVVRPMTGGLIFAATSAAEEIETTHSFFTDNPWIGVVLGVLTAGLVHGGKAASRPVINGATLGMGAPVASTAEDGASMALSFAAIFAPILVIIMLIALVALLIWAVNRAMRLRRRRKEPHELTTTFGDPQEPNRDYSY